MSGDERIEEFKKLSNEELRRISRDPYSSESDFIIASVELGHRNIAEGKVYTSKQVLENVLGRNNMAIRRTGRLNSNL